MGKSTVKGRPLKGGNEIRNFYGGNEKGGNPKNIRTTGGKKKTKKEKRKRV